MHPLTGPQLGPQVETIPPPLQQEDILVSEQDLLVSLCRSWLCLARSHISHPSLFLSLPYARTHCLSGGIGGASYNACCNGGLNKNEQDIRHG